MAEAKQLAVVDNKETRMIVHPEFSNEQVRLLAETVAKGCTQDELGFFLNVCKMKRLDPFTGQVHVVKRWDSDLGREKMTIQIGIDGFRVIAVRTGELAGITEPEYDTDDEAHPNWARVIVYRYGRDNEKIPYSAKARWSEYVQTKKDGNPNRMWATKGYIMLGKCAEALALRKAFPDELSGMYSNEEMDQADNEGTTPAEATGGKKPPVQQPQRASEKTTPAQATAQGTAPQTKTEPADQSKSQIEEVSGIIETVKTDGNQNLWMSLKNGKLVVVAPAKVDGDMKPGMFIKCKAVKKNRPRIGDFFDLESLVELSPVQDGEPSEPKPEAKMDPEMAQVADELFGGGKPQNGKEAVQGMVDNGTLKPASSLPEGKKPGSIGEKRRLRLLALCNTNKDKNNGFDHDQIKKILSALPVPVEHIKDMEVGMYEQMERWAEGTDDWREFWEDDK